MSGTSMAAPMVTGVAALILSVRPGMYGADLKNVILDNVDEITISYDGANHIVKKLNAFKAVAAVSETIFTTRELSAYTVEITGVKSFAPSRLEIPAKIGTFAVASLGKDAFFQCDNVESLTFESESFVQTIGVQAFAECKNLTSVQIPDSVTKIDFAAFIACGNLTSLTFSNEAPSLSLIELAAFGECKSLKKVYLPKSLTRLGSSAFINCTSLNEVWFNNSDGVAAIGENCFKNTASALKLYVPRSLYYSYVAAFGDYEGKFFVI